MPTITALRPLQTHGRTYAVGETLPSETAMDRKNIDLLVSQGRIAVAPDPPGSAGAKLVKATLAALDTLPADPAACGPDTIVGRLHQRLTEAERTRDQLAARLDVQRRLVADAETAIAAVDEHADFVALAPAVATVQTLPARIADLERQHRAATAERDAARSALRSEWNRAEGLRLKLKAHGPLLQRTEIEDLQSNIARYVGWPEEAPVKRATAA